MASAYLRLLSSYDPLARGLFDRSPEQGGPRRGLYSRTLKKLRAAGIVSRGDCLWALSAADNTIARQNWLSSSYTLAAVNGPTFTADRGYTGDGAAAYLTTGFVPSTAGGKLTLNDASMGMWFRTSITGTVRIPMGATDFAATAYTTIEFNAGNDHLAKMNSANTSLVGTGAAGVPNTMLAIDRSGASSLRLVKNGAVQATATTASSALPPREVYLLARNSSGSPANYSADEISIAFIGGSMTDEQHAAFYDICREWQTAVGAM